MDGANVGLAVGEPEGAADGPTVGDAVGLRQTRQDIGQYIFSLDSESPSSRAHPKTIADLSAPRNVSQGPATWSSFATCSGVQ